MVATDSVHLNDPQDLVEVALSTGESRWVMDGEDPFSEPAEGIARIAIGGKPEGRHAVESGLRQDSVVTLRLPDFDLDGDQVFDLALLYFTGEHQLVLVHGSALLPRATLDYLLDVVISRLRRVNFTNRSHFTLASEVEFMGLWLIQEKTQRVEQSIRDALNDEEFSHDDLKALRDYPERLALIEEAVGQIRAKRPDVQSGKKKPGGLADFRAPITPDRFYEYIDEAAMDAKEAVARMSGLISSQQIVLTQRRAAETARFQRVVTIVGAAVLVPGLVAAVFGAHVGFQGRESSQAFWAMLLLMAGSGIGSYAAIRFLETDVWAWLTEHRPISWFRGLPAMARLGALAVVALLVLVIGIVLMIGSESPGRAPSIEQGRSSKAGAGGSGNH